jgi:SAM-dependent methyltransferase
MIEAWRARAGRLLRLLERRRAPVDFAGLRELEPRSRAFGMERGQPIDRYYIEKFLASRSDQIRGRTLEVADDGYTRRFGSPAVEQRDVLHVAPGHPGATVIGDLTDPTGLPEGLFDCFICTQTLNVLFDVKNAVAGAHRLLRSGGVFLVTVPGVSQVSRYDQERWGAYWGFTRDSVRLLLERAFPGRHEIECFGNLVSAIALLQGIAVEDLPNPSLLDPADPDYPVVIAAAAWKGP